mgnify:CR=1 FL=1
MKPDVLVTLKALLPTPQGVGVFLSDGLKTLAIFVDPYVAAAITMFAQKVRKPRPLTHDFIVALLSGLGARAMKVVINDLRGDTFFARVYLLQESELGRGVVEIDARPSDSIALAIQQKCPIYVAAAVWDRAEDATWALQQAREQQGEGTAGEEGKGDGG